MAREFANLAVGPDPQAGAAAPRWATRNKVALEFRGTLRDFPPAAGNGNARLRTVCAPRRNAGRFEPEQPHCGFATGGPRAPVRDRLALGGPDMRFWSIDDYLCTLNARR
jgi:hypothetical protein